MRAAKHPRQAERLAALYEYGILDTPRESDFDEIVDLVSKLCETPIAIINLVDANRQWFKAEVGLGVRETSLEASFCSHAILEDDFVEIRDMHQDRRTVGNVSPVANQGFRFYAGAQLKTGDGLPLGTLCVLAYEPRALAPLQKQVLLVFAKQVMTQLDLRLALRREGQTRAIVEERTAKLNQAVEEQKILSREIDHRVKNSLQIISSLLRIQKQRAVEPETIEALSATEGRVDAIAMLHQELHQAGPFDTVDLEHLISNILVLLRRSCPKGVTIGMDFKAVLANAQKATAVAVIVNEFVSNSMKYAFPDGRGGEILLSGRRTDDDRYQIVLRDSGIGLPPDDQAAGNGGLGMMIMDASASRLGTDLEFRSGDDGVCLAFSFAPI